MKKRLQRLAVLSSASAMLMWVGELWYWALADLPQKVGYAIGFTGGAFAIVAFVLAMAADFAGYN